MPRSTHSVKMAPLTVAHCDERLAAIVQKINNPKLRKPGELKKTLLAEADVWLDHRLSCQVRERLVVQATDRAREEAEAAAEWPPDRR